MPTYTATDNLNDLVATNPPGTEDANKIDDVLRETRGVFKAVLSKVHGPTGTLRFCHYIEQPTLVAGANFPAPSGQNTWHDKDDLKKVQDFGSIDQSITDGVFQPIAGVYWVEGFVIGLRLDRFLSRVYNITDAGPVALSQGSMGYAPDTSDETVDAGASDKSFFGFILTTDGTKEYKLQQMHQTNNTASGWGVGKMNNTQWNNTAANYFSRLSFFKIG